MSSASGRFSFLTLPSTVAYHPKMNLKAARLFDRIDFLANNHKGHCWAQNDDLAYYSAQSEKSLENNLKLLEDLGFIKRIIIKESYLNRLEKKKFKTKRKILITLDKNTISDHVPVFENKTSNNSSNLKEHPPEIEEGVIPSRGGIINKTNTNNTKLSKDSYKGFEKPKPKLGTLFRKKPLTKKSSKKNLFIEKWNSYPQTQTHSNPDTKTYQKAVTLIKELQKGTFYENKIIFEECGLSQEIFSDSSILKGIDNLSKLFLEGYWPEDKSKLPKDLATLLYNPRTQKSLFVHFYFNPPELLKGKPIKKVDPKITDWFIDQEIIGNEKINHDDINQVISEVMDYQKQWIENTKNNKSADVEFIRSDPIHFKSDTFLLKQYIDFLDEEYAYMYWKTSNLGPSKPHWSEFLKHLANVCLWDENKAHLFKIESDKKS